MVSPLLQLARPRFESLDFLRGLAILGILLANIFAFGWFSLFKSGFETSFPEGYIPAVEWLRSALVSGKFRGLLALLFGVGLHLQYHNAVSRGKSFYGRYAWRMVLLFFLGLIHGILIWHGDILAIYAATALFAMVLVSLDDRVIIPLALILLFLYALLGLVVPPGDPIIGDHAHSTQEFAIFSGSNYLEQTLARIKYLGFFAMFFLVVEMELLPLFLIGIYLGRSGILVRQSINPKLVRTLSILGLVGLATNLAVAATPYNGFLEHGPHILLAIGYAVWGSGIAQKGLFPMIRSWVTPVGRMALSCYILQSLVCTTLFYGWGLGWFASLTYIQMLAVVAAVWILDIAFARLWLRFFRMGPLEYLWRSLANGPDSMPPIRIAAES